MAPWFFLSYGRRDDIGGSYVSFFWEKLADVVAQKAGLPSEVPKEQVGFLDKSSTEPGDDWGAEIESALRTCRTLVCLVSPSYLGSEYCGKEFQAFRERLEEQGGAPPLILPILWDRPEKVLRSLPPALAKLQFPHEVFGQTYAQEGLGYLMRLREHTKFVQKFAERLVSVAEEHPLPEADRIRDLKSVSNAFCGEEAHHLQAPRPKVAGPTVARFVLVAGRNEEFKGIREQTAGYGEEGGRDWRPYYPDAEEAVGILSQQVASDQSLFYETLTVSADLIQKIREAEETNTMVLLLVDPWSIRLQRYQSWLREIDRNAFLNCSLLIPWNENDGETHRSRDDLQAAMEKTLVRSFIVNNIYLRACVRSREELKQEIVGAIGEIRRRMMQLARVFHRIEGAESSTPPKISATAGA